MAKKVLMMTIAVLALSMMIVQVGAGMLSGFLWCIGWTSKIVSTDWLAYYVKIDLPNLVVLDVRSPDAYSAGHIPGAINVVEAEWYTLDPAPPFTDPLYMELPEKEDLFKLIGDAGITEYSQVVVVGSTSGLILPEAPMALYSWAGMHRVAITLLYAGVKYVSVLDGGYEKWVADGYSTETGTVTPTPVTYTGKVDESMMVSIDYVESKIGESTIVDARDEVVYNCIVQEPWTTEKGHIPTAKNLPAPSLWDINVNEETGEANYITFKDVWTLRRMVSSVVGWSRYREIIVYCGVGGYASTMYFMLSEIMGRYVNVKMYDGSAQEWTHAGKPVECP